MLSGYRYAYDERNNIVQETDLNTGKYWKYAYDKLGQLQYATEYAANGTGQKRLPIITWVALSPVILIDDGGMSRGAYAWTQVPVFGGVIIASIIVARFIKDPTSPRFIWRTIPIQLTGLLVLLAGNIAWPHTWWWSVSGTSLYALGTGLLFPVLFRFALFSHSLPKGTVSATINIVALSFMAASVEVARWVYFQAGGRIAFHCLALIAGIVVIMLVSRLLKLRQQHLLQPA